MKTHKIIYFMIFGLLSANSQAQISDRLTIALSEFKTEKIDEFSRLIYKQSGYKTDEAGKPELPVQRVSYVLPVDATISGVTFLPKPKQLLRRDVYIYPVQPPFPVSYTGRVDFRQPDANTYSSDKPYPGKLYDIESDDIYQGYHIVTLRIYPFEYIPANRVLNYYPDLEYTVNYEYKRNESFIRPHCQSVLRTEQIKHTVKHWVRNPEDVERFGPGSQQTGNENRERQQSRSNRNSNTSSFMNGLTPDYVIITCDSLKPAFQALAKWKTQKGIFTIITTTEEIQNDYYGSDMAEKIRNYLLDAWRKWGNGLYVLLGGNIDIIPSRFVPGEKNHNLSFPSDKYFSTSSPWVYNGNTFSGSNSKSLVNVLGRIPVNNSQEVMLYTQKLKDYERANNLGNLSYLKNNFYAHAYLTLTSNGQLSSYFQENIKATYVDSNVPSHINNKYICDNADCSGSTSWYLPSGSLCNGSATTNGDIEFNRDNFLSGLSSGANLGCGKFHFIYHLDHSSSFSMGTSGKDKGQSVNNTDIDHLSNGTSYQVLLSSGCNPANFAYDCIGKHYIINPNGGVAFIGHTDVGWVNEHIQLEGFLKTLYAQKTYTIGYVFQKTLLEHSKYSFWRLHLLGDPEMQIWTDIPQPLNVQINTSAVLTGPQTLQLTITGLPAGVYAKVCLYKEQDVYQVYHLSNGTHNLKIEAASAGQLHITATAHNFIPYERTLPVSVNPAPYIVIKEIQFNDGEEMGTGMGWGNQNGKNDAGETIDMIIKIQNTGNSPIENMSVHLASPISGREVDPISFISSNVVDNINIPAGASQNLMFLYKIDPRTPQILANDPNAIGMELFFFQADTVRWYKAFNFDVYCSELKTRNKSILSTTNGDLTINANESVEMDIELQNVGESPTGWLKAVLKSTAPTSVIASCISDTMNYWGIDKHEIKKSTGSFQFTTGPAYNGNPATLTFNLEVKNFYGKTWTLPFNMSRPGPISEASFTASEDEISLKWKKVYTAAGYNIYRSNVDANDEEVGGYEKLNSVPVSLTFYEDTKNLSTLKKYYYKITAVEANGNESEALRILAWTSFPRKAPFPITMDNSVGNFKSPINVADINGDGKKAIFAGTKGGTQKGFLVGLDCMGNELFDIDNNVTTHSGFAGLGKEVWAIPAIGDLNRTGRYQLVEPTRNYGAGTENALFCYSVEDKNPADGKPDLLWKIYTTQKQYLQGAVLSNIDNSADGSMEIITVSDERGSISVYNAQGTLLTDIAATNTYGYIAVADLDGDGDGEIIHTANNGVYVWHHDGSNYRGTNPLYNTPLVGYNFAGSPVVCDLDKDGHKDVLAFAMKRNNANPSIGKLFGIKYDGNPIAGFDGNITIDTNCDWYQDLSVGDLNNDDNLEIVTLAKGAVKIWNNTGQLITSIPIPGLLGGVIPILGDVNGDNLSEVIFVKDNFIYAYGMTGELASGFPLKSSETSCGGLCLSDIDGDNKSEILATASSKIEVWQTDGSPSRIEWGSERHDQYNTGEYYSICEPTFITSSTTWSTNQSLCNDLIIKSGNLTINNNSTISMATNAMVIVMSGATLEIDSGHILNANVKALAGSNVIIRNNGYIKLGPKGDFTTEAGSNVEILSGSIE